MLRAEYFGHVVKRKVYKRLAALSERTKGDRAKAVALLDAVMAGKGGGSKVLEVKDVQKAHLALDREEHEARKELRAKEREAQTQDGAKKKQTRRAKRKA